MATRKAKTVEAVYPLMLTPVQCAAIRETELSRKLRRRIPAAPEGKQFVTFSWKELDRLSDEMIWFSEEAYHPERQHLLAVCRKIETLLNKIEGDGLPTRERPRDPSQVLLQFKITLLGLVPVVWRRIQIEDLTLEQFHLVIQGAMGWENRHLHQFEIGGDVYGPPDELLDDEVLDASEYRLSELLPETGERAHWHYEYDFGDSWQHKIVFEGFVTKKSGTVDPLCTEGQNACPPEECGGASEYSELLDILVRRKAGEADEDDIWRLPTTHCEIPRKPHEFDPLQATEAMRKFLNETESP